MPTNPELATLVRKLAQRSKQSLHNLQPLQLPLYQVYSDGTLLQQAFLQTEEIIKAENNKITLGIAIVDCDLGPSFYDLDKVKLSPLISIGILIHETVMRFRDDSLVLFGHFDAAYTFPVTELQLTSKEDCHKLEQIFKVTALYNTKKIFNPTSCNSFTYVREILEAIDAERQDNLPGQLGKYVGKMLYELDNTVMKKPRTFYCPFAEKDIVFDKHSDLDDYAKEYAALPVLQRDYPADYIYLKALDRAFWIDWIAHHVNNDMTIPAKDAKPFSCPFHDPFVCENKEQY
jgi:hypothetical protein